MAEWAGQTEYGLRFEWGPAGAQRLSGAGCQVVVDVLSFTTAVRRCATRTPWAGGCAPPG